MQVGDYDLLLTIQLIVDTASGLAETHFLPIFYQFETVRGNDLFKIKK